MCTKYIYIHYTTGLVQAPVIAVPTSVGYGIGANGERARHACIWYCGRPWAHASCLIALNICVRMPGIAPLMTMLNACAPGVAVVNIDVRGY